MKISCSSLTDVSHNLESHWNHEISHSWESHWNHEFCFHKFNKFWHIQSFPIIRFHTWYNGHSSKKWNSSSKQFKQVLHFRSLTGTATGLYHLPVSTYSLWAETIKHYNATRFFSILIKFKYGWNLKSAYKILHLVRVESFISVFQFCTNIYKNPCLTRLIKTFTFPTPWFTQALYKPIDCKSVLT